MKTRMHVILARCVWLAVFVLPLQFAFCGYGDEATNAVARLEKVLTSDLSKEYVTESGYRLLVSLCEKAKTTKPALVLGKPTGAAPQFINKTLCKIPVSHTNFTRAYCVMVLEKEGWKFDGLDGRTE